MNIRPFCNDDFDRVVDFVARLNPAGEHHIGYFGVHPADIAHTLAELDPPLTEGFLLAENSGVLIGVLGAEIDAEISRAWLYGPLIEHPDWHALADSLYEAVQVIISKTIQEHELFCDARNFHCQQFAAHHGFETRSENKIFVLPRAHLAAIPPASAANWDSRFMDQFQALHSIVFPNTYYTARQIIDLQNVHTRLLIAAQGNDLQGYVFGKVDLDACEGYIDFIGVDARWRGKGIGRMLLAAAVHWMFSFPAVQHVDLVVASANTAAVRLYESFGFECERTMRAYRTKKKIVSS
jgi:ribosomal protein S18 acetylase RimI-like enzyme